MYRSIENKQNALRIWSFDTSLCSWTANIQHSCLEALKMALMPTPQIIIRCPPQRVGFSDSSFFNPQSLMVIISSLSLHVCILLWSSTHQDGTWDTKIPKNYGCVWKSMINTPSCGMLWFWTGNPVFSPIKLWGYRQTWLYYQLGEFISVHPPNQLSYQWFS